MPILGIIASSKKILTSFDSIATVVASGSPSTLTFSSIPGTYKHLQIRGIAKDTNTGSAGSISIQFNSDSGTNYAAHDVDSYGTSSGAAGQTSQSSIICGIGGSIPTDPSFANMYGLNIIDILDYSSSSKYKTVRGLTGTDSNNNQNARLSLFSGLWLSTSAITSITLLAATTAFANGSTFALYGVK